MNTDVSGFLKLPSHLHSPIPSAGRAEATRLHGRPEWLRAGESEKRLRLGERELPQKPRCTDGETEAWGEEGTAPGHTPQADRWT